VYGLSLPWVFMWFFNVGLCAKRLLQTSHEYGFPSVWVFTRTVISLLRVNVFQQTLHFYTFLSSIFTSIFGKSFEHAIFGKHSRNFILASGNVLFGVQLVERNKCSITFVVLWNRVLYLRRCGFRPKMRSKLLPSIIINFFFSKNLQNYKTTSCFVHFVARKKILLLYGYTSLWQLYFY